MVKALLMAFKPNFGEAPSSTRVDSLESFKNLKFAMMLSGLVIWLSYNGYLFSYLSFKVFEYPFKDLKSVENTNYK